MSIAVTFSETDARLQATVGDTVHTLTTPYIGSNGNWYQWDPDAAAYVDSGRSATGPQGPAGTQGPKGDRGATGAVGPQGEQGPQGEPFVYEDFTAEQLLALTGPQGPQGEKGDAGPQGIQGPQGLRGETGPQGPQGEQGEKGDKGDPGDKGEQGEPGAGVPPVTDADEGKSLQVQGGAAVWAQAASGAKEVVFGAADWAQGSGGYTLTIPRSTHGQTGTLFHCSLRHLVDGVYKANTWAVFGTDSAYDADTGELVLTGGDAYDGAAVIG